MNGANMAKIKVNAIQIGDGTLVDNKVVGRHYGYHCKYIDRLAAAGVIPWHGVRNGVKVYRRYDLAEVRAALAHGVTKSDPEPATSRAQRRKSTKSAVSTDQHLAS